MIGKVMGAVAKVATNKKAMMVVNGLFYTSSVVKAITGLAVDWNRDYEIRIKTDKKREAIVKDEVKDYLVDNRQELAKRLLTEKEKEFLVSVAEAAEKANKKAS